VKPNGEQRVLFTGWMFASSPGLNAVEHAVYDVWVLDCVDPEPPARDESAGVNPCSGSERAYSAIHETRDAPSMTHDIGIIDIIIGCRLGRRSFGAVSG
jgi:hypothetical protein